MASTEQAQPQPVVRKIVLVREDVLQEGGFEALVPVRRMAAVAVFENWFAGRRQQDLDSLYGVGEALGQRLMRELMPHFERPPVSYGKAAIVGVAGDLEHGHALLHPRLGRAMRAPIGGGQALIPSAAKVGAAGCAIDVPLGHKDDAWSFDHFDAMTVNVPDGPRPSEICLVVALSDGGRPAPRVGRGREL